MFGARATLVQLSFNTCVGINNPHIFLLLWSSPATRYVTVIDLKRFKVVRGS